LFWFTRQTDSNGDKTNVRDNSGSFDRDVVAGTSDVVHDGWIYSHPSRVGGGVDLVTVNTGPPDRLKIAQ
jgi:hypothetical protein